MRIEGDALVFAAADLAKGLPLFGSAHAAHGAMASAPGD
jgi:hypothetical protein